MEAKVEYNYPEDTSMTAADILLSIKNVGFDSLLPLKKVQAPEDLDKYTQQGYPMLITETEFHQLLPNIDTNKIWITPSLSRPLLYYNPDTLAAAGSLELIRIPGGQPASQIEALVQHMEDAVAEKDFRGSIQALPEAMRMEYFNLLLEKFPDDFQDIPNLFRLFFGNYIAASYGFDRIHPDTFRTIAALRTPEQAQEVQAELAEFPDTLRIYRGGSSDISLAPERASSWTTSIQSALFFAGHLGSKAGYITTGTVPKDKVIYVQMDSKEKEVIVFPEDVHIEGTLHLASLEEIHPTVKEVVPMYHFYRGMLSTLDFEMDSDQHGRLHSARVLLHTLVISELLHLPASDRHILSIAAIYHDSKRNNDGEDQVHGQYSAAYYRSVTHKYDPIVNFIIEYHCRPDEEGYAAIRGNHELSKRRTRAKKLFDIFKDADALDRVRFGLYDLDMNQLRNPEAKTLPLFAMQCVEHIEI